MPPRPRQRAALITLAALIAVALGVPTALWLVCMRMPGKSYRAAPPPVNEAQRIIHDRLSSDVHTLAGLGPRHVGVRRTLDAGAAWIEAQLAEAGYEVERQTFDVSGVPCSNLVVEVPGAKRPDEIVVVGAHYDTETITPGADDNASGVAGMLSLARTFAQRKPARGLRFIAFVNEEMPHYRTGTMGSFQAARRSRERGENVIAMLSLESIGYYTTERRTQHYPPPLSLFYPDTGDFIGFVSNIRSRSLLRQMLGTFRAKAQVASEGAALPELLPGVSWSDHWAYWAHDYPALMITDTAPFRNPHYHRPTDTPDTLDYLRLTHVVLGLETMLDEFLNP